MCKEVLQEQSDLKQSKPIFFPLEMKRALCDTSQTQKVRVVESNIISCWILVLTLSSYESR